MQMNANTTGGPKTMVAVFAYGGVWPMTMVSVVRDLCRAATAMGVVSHRDEAARVGYTATGPAKDMRPWQVSLSIPHGDALIDRARSICARDFLKTDNEVLLMIDHDLEWTGADADYEGDLLHLARLAAQTKGIVGGVVSKRTRGEGVATLFKKEQTLNMGAPETIEAHYVGSAFTAYHRDVVQAVSDSMIEMQPGFKPTFLPCVVDHPVGNAKLHLSEDWAFCHRASHLGFPVHVSTRPIVGHWGHYKYTVTADSESAEATAQREAADNPPDNFPAVPRDNVSHETNAAPLTISLLHATRGRPAKARAAYDAWMSRASGAHNLEYILSVDVDDKQMVTPKGNELKLIDESWPTTVNVIGGESRPGPVDAYNRALYASTGDIIVQVHDDIIPPKDWDAAVVEAFGDTSRPALLHVDDGTGDKVNPDKPDLLTILVGTRAWFEGAGFFYHPSYPSVYCDDDITAMAQRLDAIIDAMHIRFNHAWEGAASDNTYRRAYQKANWAAGEKAFAARKSAGFPCEPGRWPND